MKSMKKQKVAYKNHEIKVWECVEKMFNEDK